MYWTPVSSDLICDISGVSSRYRLLPLHSQIPREDQRRVFEPVPQGVTKVRVKNMV